MEPLDRIDRELLRLLSKDGRTSNKVLAAEVGLSPSSCHARVRRLFEEGHVRGVHAEVDPRSLGASLRAIIFVRISRHQKAVMEPFRRRVAKFAEVLDVYYVAGSYDVLIHVAVKDVDHLRHVVEDHISTDKAVGHLETSLIFEHARNPVLPDYVEA